MQTNRPRPLGRDFGDTYSRQEMMALLTDTLNAPAALMDTALLRECLLALDPAYGRERDARRERLWSHIRQATAGRHPVSARRVLVTVLAAALILALAAAAIAAAVNRGVFNFIWDFGLDRSSGAVQPAAHELVKTDLASHRAAHVDVHVREAVYDGRELRVVYAVTERGRTEPFTEEDAYLPIIEAGALDGLSCCDSILVNGQDAYFYDTFQAPGENPGEMLYYLQTDLKSAGIIPMGDTMTIELPMLRLELEKGPGQNRVPEGLSFTIDSIVPSGTVRAARPAGIEADGVRLTLEVAEFTPVRGLLQIKIHGSQDENDPLAMRFAEATLYAADGTPLGITSINYWDYNDPSGILIEYGVSPPEAWPDAMLFALPGEDGSPDRVWRLPVAFEP